MKGFDADDNKGDLTCRYIIESIFLFNFAIEFQGRSTTFFKLKKKSNEIYRQLISAPVWNSKLRCWMDG